MPTHNLSFKLHFHKHLEQVADVVNMWFLTQNTSAGLN